MISFTYWLDPAHLFCLAEVMKILDTEFIYIFLNHPSGNSKYFYCDISMVCFICSGTLPLMFLFNVNCVIAGYILFESGFGGWERGRTGPRK